MSRREEDRGREKDMCSGKIRSKTRCEKDMCKEENEVGSLCKVPKSGLGELAKILRDCMHGWKCDYAAIAKIPSIGG